MRGLRQWALAVALTLGGCGDDGGSNSPTPDAGPSGGADAATAGIPLLVWVDDLVEHRTSDEAEPDTVDDKVVIDNEDPELFNHWLVQPGP